MVDLPAQGFGLADHPITGLLHRLVEHAHLAVQITLVTAVGIELGLLTLGLRQQIGQLPVFLLERQILLLQLLQLTRLCVDLFSPLSTKHCHNSPARNAYRYVPRF